MPRVDGEFVAPFPPVVPDTTIESVVHNGTVADFVADANAPRPIVAGGTGANNHSGARNNLLAAMARQTVTNFDSHVWENGFFQSVPGATGAPYGTSVAFVGACQLLDATNMIVQAYPVTATDPAPPALWLRDKIAGVWQAWACAENTLTAAVNTKLTKSGDTMTGFLTLHANPSSALHAATKQYVDSNSAATGAVLKAPSPLVIQTMMAPLVMAGGVTENFIRVPTLVDTDPGNEEHCVNKQYLMGHTRKITDALDALMARVEALERRLA